MREIRRIVCPIDFSQASQAALDQAAAIADWFGAAMTLLHVASPARVLEGPLLFAALPAGAVADTGVSRARRALEEYVRPLRDRGLAVDAVVLEDADVEGRILAIAGTLHADLLVMGTHGRCGLDWLIVGSVTEHVLRHAACPVLTVPPAATRRARPPFKRLLCPIDFSEPSLEALRFVVPIAEEGDARLTLLHVLPDSATPDGFVLAETALDRARCEAPTKQRLEALVPKEAATFCDPVTKVTWGTPYRSIVEVAADEASDLIVMGAGKHGLLDRILHGTNVPQVIRHATCPVLTLCA
jgi:nucleotide-binding universal stress UspA family protein